MRIKETGDLDLALITKIAPDCSLTFCTGMETAEHSASYWKEKDLDKEFGKIEEISKDEKL